MTVLKTPETTAVVLDGGIGVEGVYYERSGAIHLGQNGKTFVNKDKLLFVRNCKSLRFLLVFAVATLAVCVIWIMGNMFYTPIFRAVGSDFNFRLGKLLYGGALAGAYLDRGLYLVLLGCIALTVEVLLTASAIMLFVHKQTAKGIIHIVSMISTLILLSILLLHGRSGLGREGVFASIMQGVRPSRYDLIIVLTAVLIAVTILFFLEYTTTVKKSPVYKSHHINISNDIFIPVSGVTKADVDSFIKSAAGLAGDALGKG